MSTFRILSFDGGGIKGALSTGILKRLLSKYPQLIDKTDLFAGTSTGALIALALAYGQDINDIDSMYDYKTMKYIFSHPTINLLKPKFNNKALIKILNSVFHPSLTIGDLKKYVFIPSFNTKGFYSDNWEPVFFNNLSKESTYSIKVIDAAVASSAAPTYFPSHNNFIDGGVITNNPSMAAIIYTMKILKPKHSISDFRILSIGTGNTLNQIGTSTESWGALQWMFSPFSKVKTPLVSILLNDSSLAHTYCEELLGSNYHRINPILKHNIEIDEYKKVSLLKSAADNIDLSEEYKFIENIYLK